MTFPTSTPKPIGPGLPFVGRDRELALLRAALERAIAGHGSIALISGEAGIGKTTLADVLCAEASDGGALILTGRCYDLTDTAPYAPWIELFEAYPDDETLPEIPPAIARGEIDEWTASQQALFASVRQFLEQVACIRPVVILLDDQHWADDASLDLLRYLARAAPDLPVLLLVTFRADELTPLQHLSRLLPLLVRESRALQINLRPLVSDDLWALIRTRYQLDASDEAHLTSHLYDRAEGNPFFTSEVLQTLEDEGVLRQGDRGWILGDLARAPTPVLVEHIVAGRLSQLGLEDQRLVALAAVIGQEASLELWSEVARVDEQRLLPLINRASQARLLVEMPDGHGVRFSHALLRQIIYESQSPARRRQRHQRAGMALAARATADPDAVAYHFRQSGDPQAVSWLIQAGTRAQRAYSWRAAAERFEAAITILGESDPDAEERGWLLVRLARVRRYSSPEEGLAHLEEAGRIARATDDRALAGWVLWQMGLFRCFQGHIERGLEQLEAGVTAIAALTPVERARLQDLEPVIGMVPDSHQDQGTLAQWLAMAGRYAEAVEWAAPYDTETATPVGFEGSYGDAYVALGSSYAALGYSENSRAAFARARASYRDDRHDIHVARAMMNELQMRVLVYETDRLAERQRLVTEAEEAWIRGSGVFADNLAGAVQLPLHYVEGRWDEAVAVTQSLREHGTLALRAEATRWLGLVARARGDSDLLRSLVTEWLPAGSATAPGNTMFRVAQSMQRAAAEMAIDAGDLEVARRWLEAHDHWLEWSGAVIGRAEGGLCWARYWWARDELALTRDFAEAVLDHAGNPRQLVALIAARRLFGELDTESEQFGKAAAHLEIALELAEACAMPYERALTQLALARLRCAEGDAGQAKMLLDVAGKVLESLEATPALAEIEAVAAQLANPDMPASAGERETLSPSTTGAPGEELPVALTDRELDVLRMLPAGRTNQEIADLLFLSPKTVENHISRILAKTDLPNRAAAAAWAQRHDLT